MVSKYLSPLRLKAVKAYGEMDRFFPLLVSMNGARVADTLETMKHLNEEVLIALPIEHRDAMENLPDILSVPGIDAAFVGPEDLAASLGKPGQTGHPDVEQAVRRVIAVCRDKGVIPGIHTGSVDKAKHWIDQGMKFVGFGTDIKLILQVCRSSVKELRSLTA